MIALGDISSANTTEFSYTKINITSTITTPLISYPPRVPYILLTGKHVIG